MTHQNHQTNGASLEDCHTNFFALTDLCGIKWRKFANGERPNASANPLDDAILRSYSRCLQADILCVWRRVQCTKQENSDPNALTFELNPSKVHPPLSLAAAKELWIFWYGEEPDLKDLVDAELLRIAANQQAWTGTWERGLTYECRSLLFKALHNLMERFVLTKDIVRFGKWFVQPCTSNERHFDKCSQHLSFSFTFFVHGDTVCASIDLREHPTVRPLTKEHLTEAATAFAAIQQNTQDTDMNGIDVGCYENLDGHGQVTPRLRKVILAPFGMAAILTGNSYKISDPMAEKILEEWAAFFPLCNKENNNVPPVVEVISGGHKMYHPAIYVLVTDLDDLEDMEELEDKKSLPSKVATVDAAAFYAFSTNDIKPDINSFSIPTMSKTNTAIVTPTSISIAPQTKTSNITATTNNTITDKQTKQNNNTINNLRRLADSKQMYYDTSASSFTCNTTNTHAMPQAANEMPERGWQDCITNLLHFQTQSINSSNTKTAIANYTTNTDELMDTNDCKQRVQQQLQLQQAQQKCFWGFVDPTSKTSCKCTK